MRIAAAWCGAGPESDLVRRNGPPAFTLLEVLLVVALLGLLAALVLPDFTTAAAAENLRESAHRLRALAAMCRAEAMNATCRHRILVRSDGSVRVRRQADPLKAPHLYITPREDWAHVAVLLPDVWVEAVQMLPDGPSPIRIIDDQLEFPETELDPIAVEDLDRPLEINFEPDGTCNSVRWVLRDARGHALLLTLDGRLGRVTIEPWNQATDEVRRPAPLPPEADIEDEYNPEDYR